MSLRRDDGDDQLATRSPADRNARAYDAHAREWAEHIRGDAGHKYLEKPAMERELPGDLTGQSVLCIGVGSGAELAVLLDRQPGHVVGVDVSGNLLAIAAARHPGVRFARMDMMTMALSGRTFDFVYSSLAFHYANDWDQLLAEVHRVLRPGGALLFSTHHPAYWSQKPGTGRRFTNARGITLTEHVATLPAANVEIVYYNHPDATSIAESVRRSGLTLRACFAAEVRRMTHAEYAALETRERERYDEIRAKNSPHPLFLIVRATRPGAT